MLRGPHDAAPMMESNMIARALVRAFCLDDDSRFRREYLEALNRRSSIGPRIWRGIEIAAVGIVLAGFGFALAAGPALWSMQ